MTDQTQQLRAAMLDALEDLEGGIGGTIEEADLITEVGVRSVEHVLEVSDIEGPDQADTYDVLCDLLATRRSQGAGSSSGRPDSGRPASGHAVFGCVVFGGEVDPTALIPALAAMQRTGTLTPVIPLGRRQAARLAGAEADLDAFVDDAIALIEVAADRNPSNLSATRTLLEELASLVDRYSV